ncbi:hypothetical protein, partial [Mycobacterium tuberculosis]|uniref:hypothetical protein n=2 Tax=Mycobacterium tuberculosis TaxID=1773 RepID=UPI001BFFB77A
RCGPGRPVEEDGNGPRPCDDAGRVGPLRRTAMGLGGVTMRAGHGRVTTLMLCLFEPRPPCAAPD